MDGANEMTCGLDYADSLFDYKEKKNYIESVFAQQKTILFDCIFCLQTVEN